ncbi:hypothetical protein BCR43DRAFT_315910 [Syncephalastrum racemosum]|uniref:PH domain-containing protein n=1 Tax=Syncephalastrum racemosum TaxID=13706 RepID=A0A1X2HB55_SYNRA|nr:hypothetical protein BCR43DRAFT_315910 [Syncephalastrum racemosum]
MSNYPTLRNPLLDSSPPAASQRTRRFMMGGLSTSASIKSISSASTASFKSLFTRSIQQLSSVGSQMRLGQSHKRIGPSLTFSAGKGAGGAEKYFAKPKTMKRTGSLMVATHKEVQEEPMVHYNGSYNTMDQFSDEQLQWIYSEPVSGIGVRQPLKDCCTDSIVMRKPVKRSQTFPTVRQPARPVSSKAMFYLRVIQITNKNTSKPCYLRCAVQINQDIMMGQHVASEKCGKNSTQADVDEIFLLDFDEPSTVTVRVFSQPRSALGGLFANRSRQQDSYLGREDFQVSVRPTDKELRRVQLVDGPECDLIVVCGTFVSIGAQALLENRRLFSEYITVYARGRGIPKWERYWAALHGNELLLYDFEYKESRPPLFVIPLRYFVLAMHPSVEDDERQVDVGALGLALQFTERVVNPREVWTFDEDDVSHFEGRMYVLPDNAVMSAQWEAAFAQVASFLDEFRNLQEDSQDDEEEDEYDSDEYDEDEDEEKEFRSSLSDLGRGFETLSLLDHTHPCHYHNSGKYVPAKFLW